MDFDLIAEVESRMSRYQAQKRLEPENRANRTVDHIRNKRLSKRNPQTRQGERSDPLDRIKSRLERKHRGVTNA